MRTRIKVALFTALCFALSCVSVFAESGSGGTPNNAVVSAMTTVSNDMVATAESIIPVALTVVGIALVVVFGVRIFKKVAK